MESICKKSLTVHTEVGLSPANQGNNTMDKLGPVPSETPCQSLFFFFLNYICIVHGVIITN